MKPYYQDDAVTIYHGDCREVTAWLEADVLVTDPPYGIDYSSGWARDLIWSDVYADAADGSIRGDLDLSARDDVLALWGGSPALVFGSLRAAFPAGWRQVLVWDKGEAAGMGDLRVPWKPNWEPVFVLGEWRSDGRRSGVIRATNISRVSMGRVHPHMKPPELLRQLIECTPDGAVIADPFMGSGSTLRAAKDLGRKAIGVELEERYCEVAARRCAQEVLPL